MHLVLSRLSAQSVTVLAAMLLGGCMTVTTHGDPAAATANASATGAYIVHAPPPHDGLNATAWFQKSVERDLVYGSIYRAAGEHLAAALADKSWDALPRGDRSNDASALPPAIIVDIDETVLDNSYSQVRQIRDGVDFNETDWAQWVQQGAATPLPGALAFLRAAADQGVTVFYISNRKANLTQASFDNLRAVGFPITDASQVLGNGVVVEGCEQHGSDKGCRREWVGRRFRVLMQFGDQVGDFVNIASNTEEGRRAAITPYLGWVGQRWWVLPNPMYGSWEPALFGNDWNLPPAARRAAKEAALEDLR
ncbi:MAG: HAD family acid phosphatase [Luteimonas sp.]